MNLTRRKFLKLLGLGSLLSLYPKVALAVNKSALDLLYLRRIITSDSAHKQTIMWQSSRKLIDLVFEYAAEDGNNYQANIYSEYLQQDNETCYFYYVTLNELTPAKTYKYRIKNNLITSNWHYFTTAAENSSFQALLFSDSQCGENYTTWKKTLSIACNRHQAAAFWADIGDLTDNGESSWHWQSFWQASDSISAKLPMVPVMGNHECYGLNWQYALPVRYLKNFALPTNGSRNSQGYYYAFDYGPVHFYVLNTQMLELADFKPDLLQEQIAWLKKNKTTHHKKWQVVLMHKDILAYDEYQPGTGTTFGFSDVGHAFMPAFDELGIDLVVTGHMHTYRNRGHIKNFQPSTTGPVYIMGGPAGNEAYTVPADNNYDLKAIVQPTPCNYLLLSADQHHLKLTCFTIDGVLIDTTTINK